MSRPPHFLLRLAIVALLPLWIPLGMVLFAVVAVVGGTLLLVIEIATWLLTGKTSEFVDRVMDKLV